MNKFIKEGMMGSNNIQIFNGVQPSFKSADFSKFSTGFYKPPVQSPAPISAGSLNNDYEDSFESYSPPPVRRKDGPVQRFRNTISGLKKFGIRFGEYTWATVIGGIVGLMTGFMSVGIMHAVHAHVKNKQTNSGKLAAIFTNPTSQKVGFAATFLAAVGLNLFNASQNVNERAAAVDHRWNTGHRKEY